jgi:hypothetical protein
MKSNHRFCTKAAKHDHRHRIASNQLQLYRQQLSHLLPSDTAMQVACRYWNATHGGLRLVLNPEGACGWQFNRHNSASLMSGLIGVVNEYACLLKS